MAISEELREIIFILEDEGFGALAGELLTEISLGTEVEKDIVSAEEGRDSERETAVVRVPIAEEDQLRDAMEFLRLRLVLPVRAFAEAERLAGQLAGDGGVRIRFIDPVEQFEAEPLSRRDVGDTGLADELDALLDRLPTMLSAPSIGGI
jgi:hypothetical protein